VDKIFPRTGPVTTASKKRNDPTYIQEDRAINRRPRIFEPSQAPSLNEQGIPDDWHVGPTFVVHDEPDNQFFVPEVRQQPVLEVDPGYDYAYATTGTSLPPGTGRYSKKIFKQIAKRKYQPLVGFTTDSRPYGPMPQAGSALDRERKIDALLSRRSYRRSRPRYRRRRYIKRRRYSRYGRRYMRGRGDYTTPLGAAGSAFGSWAGGHLGGMAGDFVGGMLTGVGDYTVKKNVLMSGTLPEMVNVSSAGGVVIRFQEYLTDIVTSATPGEFKLDSFLLNPGTVETFPWLSQIASNFEEYEWEGIVFGFKSMSGDALNSINTALGTVMMATQYDVNDTPFTSKMEMLNYEFSQAIKPSESTLHMIECARAQTVLPQLYVLPTGQAIPANSDPRFYHLGRFSIATQGMQGPAVNIGELHVTYQIKLLKPKLFDSLDEGIPFYKYQAVGIGIFSGTEPLGNGSGIITESFAGIDCSIDYTSQVLTIPSSNLKNRYFIELQWIGDSGQTLGLTTPTSSSGTISSPKSSFGASSICGMFSFVIETIPGQPTLIAFADNYSVPLSNQTFRIRITNVNPAFS
jgi:hypothetical protein